MCLSQVGRASVVRQSYDIHEIVVWQSSDDCLIKKVYVGTHDNVYTAQQSHDCGKTLSRQPQDSDTTKNRRAKKVHVQFSSHDTRQRHRMLKISRNCRAIVVRRSHMTRDLTKFHVVELHRCVLG